MNIVNIMNLRKRAANALINFIAKFKWKKIKMIFSRLPETEVAEQQTSQEQLDRSKRDSDQSSTAMNKILTSGDNASKPLMSISVTDASASMNTDDEDFEDAQMHVENIAQTDSNPFGTKKLRRQSAVEVPRTPQVEIRSPVANRDAEEYNMGFPNRGLAVILNHMTFDHEDYRHGSDVDCKRLQTTLNNLGFETRVSKDLKYDGVNKALKEVAKEDHSLNDCLLIAVLSHGGRGELHAKDHAYPIDLLWSFFTSDRCPSLAGKPKIFIIQACRGMKVDPGTVMVETMADTVDAPKGKPAYTIPTHADIIVANATADGYYAWRNPIEGSWYIKILCEELEKHSETRDFQTILTFVARRVAIECESVVPDTPKMHQKKQIPCVISMLTRLLYLNKKTGSATNVPC